MTSETTESQRHALAALATTVAIVIAVLCVPGVSDRLTPPFARTQMVTHFGSAVGE
jgi:hypothetical protein